ncbi:MAG: HEAT repeat domain-containing protein [Phycisphaeraceae bacterium]|nr:HEAT repeat domain-containing protein [Phycisphaeraceae bacterium]
MLQTSAFHSIHRKSAAPIRRLAVFALLTAVFFLSACTGFDPLGELGVIDRDPTPTEAVQMATDRYDPDTRRRGLSFLAAAPFGGEEPYVRLYREAATDLDPTVRATAIMALGFHGRPADAAIIIGNLQHNSSMVRWESAKALQRIHNPEAVFPLIEALRDDQIDVRQAAATALGQYPRPVVVDALINALDDANFGVVATAKRSLIILTGQDHGTDPRTWAAWRREVAPEAMFEGGQDFQWQPFNRPRQWWQRAMPFGGRPAREPRPPTGLENPTTD